MGTIRCLLITQLLAAFQHFVQFLTAFDNFFISFDNFFDNFFLFFKVRHKKRNVNMHRIGINCIKLLTSTHQTTFFFFFFFFENLPNYFIQQNK